MTCWRRNGEIELPITPKATRPTGVSDVMTSETLRSHETTQKVRVSCSMDNPWPVHPHPRAVAGLKGPLAGRGPLIEQHREPGEHRRESSVHHRGPEEGPGVQIGDKGSDHPHPGGANPHDSRVLVHAA